jgi:hypothetical protein
MASRYRRPAYPRPPLSATPSDESVRSGRPEKLGSSQEQRRVELYPYDSCSIYCGTTCSYSPCGWCHNAWSSVKRARVDPWLVLGTACPWLYLAANPLLPDVLHHQPVIFSVSYHNGAAQPTGCYYRVGNCIRLRRRLRSLCSIMEIPRIQAIRPPRTNPFSFGVGFQHIPRCYGSHLLQSIESLYVSVALVVVIGYNTEHACRGDILSALLPEPAS